MGDKVIEFLSHHGVKGQKWGVRRKRRGASASRTKFTKPPKKLSDDEINKRIKRMELEKKYNSLNKSDSKAKDFVDSVLSTTGRKVATTVLTGGTIFLVKAALESRGVSSDAARAITRS